MASTSWDPKQYFRFAAERTRPCRDLLARIEAESFHRIVDLGCGPGNSTRQLVERWPEAEITGVDHSAEMIAAARKERSAVRWIVEDITQWATKSDEKLDVVFSNAALQWVEDHAQLLPRLMARVQPGGVLAFQVPYNFDATAHRLMREIAASPAWRKWFPEGAVREWHVHDAAFYYDVLAPHARNVDLWETEYIHVMPDAAAIVEWYKGAGMRPFLDVIESKQDRERFIAEYLERISEAYPKRTDGRVLFPFRRLFAIAS